MDAAAIALAKVATALAAQVATITSLFTAGVVSEAATAAFTLAQTGAAAIAFACAAGDVRRQRDVSDGRRRRVRAAGG